MSGPAGQSVVFCYAVEDSALAHEIGDFLEANLPITAFYDEGLISADSDLVDAVARGLSADIAVVLFSPDSIPKRWDRARWEPAFLQQPREFDSQIVFVMARQCRVPELLKRQAFCDASKSVLDGKREVKRHLVRQHAVDLPQPVPDVQAHSIEELRIALADRPGLAEGVDRDLALGFATACQDDFEGSFWIDCAGRSQAGILGDVSHALGLRLSGGLGQNRRALFEFCKGRRCLFVFEHLSPDNFDLVRFGGRSSALMTTASPTRELLTVDATAQLFGKWVQHPEKCLQHLRDAQAHLQGCENLSTATVALLKHYDRLAEAEEILSNLIDQATARDDQDAMHRLTWDRSWMLGHWGEPYDSQRAIPQIPRKTTQLGFDFS